MFFEAIFRTLLYHIQIKVQEKFKFCSVFEVAKKGNCENLFFLFLLCYTGISSIAIPTLTTA